MSDENERFTESEASVSETTEDGDVVSEDVSAVVDHETGLTAIDDLITVESPDGSVVIDETVAVVDEFGNAEEIAETIAVMDADGDVEILTVEED